jgi:hypothetical protein
MRRSGAIPLGVHRALHRVNGASKQEHCRPPCSLCGPVVPNEPGEDCAPFRQPLERADLIGAHEAAVALHICCEDGDEASADCHRV